MIAFLLMAIVLCTSIGSAKVSADDSRYIDINRPGKVITESNNLNVRKSPAANGDVVGKFKKSKEIFVKGGLYNGKESWYSVRGEATTGKVIEGWVYSKYVKVIY